MGLVSDRFRFANCLSRLKPRTAMLVALFTCLFLSSCGGSGSQQSQGSGNNASPAASSPSPSGHAAACDNPFYPPSSSAKWEYRATFGSNPLTLTVRRMGLEVGGFTDHLEFSDGSSVDVPWNCTEDGLLCSEFVPVDLGHYPAAFKLKYTRGTGVTLPPIGSWAVGYHWTGGFSVTGTRSIQGGTQDATGMVDVDNKIVGSGKVTVPTGTFDAFQVDSTMTQTLNIGSGTTAGSTLHISVKTSAWYAKDVGLVKIAYSGDPGTGMEELTSFSK